MLVFSKIKTFSQNLITGVGKVKFSFWINSYFYPHCSKVSVIVLLPNQVSLQEHQTADAISSSWPSFILRHQTQNMHSLLSIMCLEKRKDGQTCIFQRSFFLFMIRCVEITVESEGKSNFFPLPWPHWKSHLMSSRQTTFKWEEKWEAKQVQASSFRAIED